MFMSIDIIPYKFCMIKDLHISLTSINQKWTVFSSINCIISPSSSIWNVKFNIWSHFEFGWMNIMRSIINTRERHRATSRISSLYCTVWIEWCTDYYWFQVRKISYHSLCIFDFDIELANCGFYLYKTSNQNLKHKW